MFNNDNGNKGKKWLMYHQIFFAIKAAIDYAISLVVDVGISILFWLHIVVYLSIPKPSMCQCFCSVPISMIQYNSIL